MLSAPMPPLAELLERGGALMIPLLVLNFLAWVVLLERGFFWIVALPGLLRERQLMRRYLKSGSGAPVEAFLKDAAPRSASRFLSRGAFVKPAALYQTREPAAWEEEADAIVHRSEKFLTVLTVIATLGTSIGLLGTVIGVSHSLKFIESDFSSTVAGLSVALYTTVGGLVVSIQSALFYAVLQAMSNALNNGICGWVRALRQRSPSGGEVRDG